VKNILMIAAAVPILLGSSALGQQAPRPIARADYIKMVDGRFGNIDANHDGIGTRAEFAAEQAREINQGKAKIAQALVGKFKQLDTNKDGQLSFREFAAVAPPVGTTETPDQLLARLDTNRDGKVTPDEYRAPELARFARVDTNRDGIVSPAEAQAANKK
jgi:Ca2+-binding EF-hand superfamily protein